MASSTVVFLGSGQERLEVDGDPRAVVNTLANTLAGWAQLKAAGSGGEVWVNPSAVAYVEASASES